MKGFTLVEVLVGLSIAVIASVSVAYTVATTNKVIDAGEQTFVATNLAHEGLELTRKVRDDAWFAAPPATHYPQWADDLCSGLGDGINSDAIALGEDLEQTFSRSVTVNCDNAYSDNIEDPEFVEVTSTVTWEHGQAETKSVVLKERLYNWYVGSL